MSKSIVFLTIGITMVVIMIIFAAYALQHPEMSFIGGRKIVYTVYIIYLIATIAMFVLSKATVKK